MRISIVILPLIKRLQFKVNNFLFDLFKKMGSRIYVD